MNTFDTTFQPEPTPVWPASHSPEIMLLSMGELANLPAPQWLVPDLIPDHGLGLLVGAPASGKSFVLLEIAQAVCRGVPFLGDPKLTPTRSGWVLALLPEASASWATRTRAYCSYYDVDFDDGFLCCIQQNDLADTVTWGHVLNAIQGQVATRGTPPALVIVDTLSASIPGRDENSQAEMTLLTSHLQGLVAMGSCVIVAHHTTKYSSKYRGSSALLGNCDWMLSIVPSGRGYEFQAAKLRDAAGITGKAFEIKPHGESAVCIGLDAPGAWRIFDTIIRNHPGLLQALLKHGFQLPGEKRTPSPINDICDSGVSLKALLKTWSTLDPITKKSTIDLTGYKATHGARTTALLNLVAALVQGNVLEVAEGQLSRRTRDLNPVVQQVLDDEDE